MFFCKKQTIVVDTLKKIGKAFKMELNNLRKLLISKAHLFQIYSCARVASQSVQPLLDFYRGHKYALVNHLVHVKPFVAGCNCCRTSLHTCGNDAENPQYTTSSSNTTKRKINK